MNTFFPFHISGDALEKYALGRLPDADCDPLDEHLLICPTCQARLEEVDEYVKVMQAATAALAGTPSKPCGRADRATDVVSS
jgi:anti-sigma factor RsiW